MLTDVFERHHSDNIAAETPLIRVVAAADGFIRGRMLSASENQSGASVPSAPEVLATCLPELDSAARRNLANRFMTECLHGRETLVPR